jgi:hypothetical protein
MGLKSALLVSGILVVGLSVEGNAKLSPRDTMMACYVASATVYGGASCQPPESVVGAVFGSCAKEEEALKAKLRKLHPNDPEFVDRVMEGVRAGMSTRIQSWVLDSQIKIRKCP